MNPMTTPQISLKPNLEPCPLCGGKPKTDRYSPLIEVPGSAVIKCGKCMLTLLERTLEKAIAAWNTRQPERPDVRALEALEHAAETFERYAALHRAKGTDEGTSKAIANLEEANKCRRSLRAIAHPEAKPPFACRVCGGKLGDAIPSESGVSWKCQECGHSVTGQPEAKGGGERPQVDRATTGLKALVKFMDDLPQAARESVSYTEFRAVVDLLRTDTAQHQEMQRDGERCNCTYRSGKYGSPPERVKRNPRCAIHGIAARDVKRAE